MGDSSVATSGTKKKKKGIFRTISKGITKKKKKQRPDDESVVSVALDGRGGPRRPAAPASGGGGGAAPGRRSVSFGDNPNSYPSAIRNTGGPSSSSASSGSAPAVPIQVVLLLMDPSSRRFELLQLEFDSNKAMVSDVLRQIQSSATEKTLRDMIYEGVCDASGMEMIASMKLSKFCKGNDVVMAMPRGMTGRDTAKLAGPILGDPKVEDMLEPCGINTPKTAVTKSRSAPASSGNKLPKVAEDNSGEKFKRPTSPQSKARSGGSKTGKKNSSSSSLPTAILGIIISSLLFFTLQRHISVTSPIQSGDILLPGQWKSQCGIFDLFPTEWLDKLPMDKLAPSCDGSSSSTLELGTDGTLRYFTNTADSGDSKDGGRKETWSAVVGSFGGKCLEGDEEDDEQCVEEGATFVKDGSSWYVTMDGSRTSLNRNVIRDFTSED